jgi:lipoate-protein ligase A
MRSPAREPGPRAGTHVSIVKVLPELNAGGGVQMALDAGLLETAEDVIARRYTWDPPALSIGKFQQLELRGPLPFEVVRRPTGGRAVLHGVDFEWSFAVAFPPGSLGPGPGAGVDVTTAYDLVNAAFTGALGEMGVTLDDGHETPYQRSALCFASALRHDLLSRGEKIIAIAQARRGGFALVHGSVLERRPPEELVAAAAQVCGEPWQGDGLAGAGYLVPAEMLWSAFLSRLETGLRRLAPT